MSPAGTDRQYAISEVFTSPQGEGLYAGCMMTFVRFAGCTVGKKIKGNEPDWEALHAAGKSFSLTRELPVYTEVCTLFDGRRFLCDTDFRPKEFLTAKEILERVPPGVERLCITGGEPLNHDLTELLRLAWDKMLDVHIETSGTVPIRKGYPKFKFMDLIGEAVDGWIWLTVSPKYGALPEMIELASEVKLLVDERFDPACMPTYQGKHLLYLQPVNFELRINSDNVQRCLELQKQFPHARISSQEHKLWNVR